MYAKFGKFLYTKYYCYCHIFLFYENYCFGDENSMFMSNIMLFELVIKLIAISIKVNVHIS